VEPEMEKAFSGEFDAGSGIEWECVGAVGEGMFPVQV